MDTNNFRIAGLDVRIIFKDTTVNNMSLLTSFEPFRLPTDSQDGLLLFQLTVDDTLRPIA